MRRIVVSILAYNAEPFIKYCLDSIYDIADMIIIVEGAFDRQRIYGSRSTDRTIEIIRKYHDPKTKIRLLFMNGHEHEHKNVALRYCDPGDWYFMVDADEIYTSKALGNLRRILQTDRKTDLFYVRWNNFYYSFRYYLRELSSPRLYRVSRGCRFIWKNMLATGSGVSYERLRTKKISPNKALIFHYGYLWNVKQKMALYGRPGRVWYETIFRTFTWKDRNRIYRLNALLSKGKPGIHYHGGQKLKIFKGKHPQIMRAHPLSGRDLTKEFQKGYAEPPYRIDPFTFLLRYLLYGVILK